MEHRRLPPVTRTGDNGRTNLASGLRVDKDSPRIEALGAVAELNSSIGFLASVSESEQVRRVCTLIQHDLFDLEAQIRSPGASLLSRAHLARLEDGFERISSEAGMSEEVILPGGAPAAACAHVARAVCRRAERRLFTMTDVESGMTGVEGVTGLEDSAAHEFGLSYLNRLSDLLFVAARMENRAAGQPDIQWERAKSLTCRPAS